MAEVDCRRVALLARPGEACERLRAALREAGGDIVLEADPTAHRSAGAARGGGAQTVLVALDPAVEDALERFDDVLADPRDRSDLRRSRAGRAPRRLGCRALGAPPGRQAASPRRRAAAGRGDPTPPLARRSEPLAHLPASGAATATSARFADARADAPIGSTVHAGDLDMSPSRTSMLDPVLPESTSARRRSSASGARRLRCRCGRAADGDGDASPTTSIAGPAGMRRASTARRRAQPPRRSRRLRQRRFRRDLDDLRAAHRRHGTRRRRVPLRAATRDGAVLVLAGIGGPDAVRQLLGALPQRFPARGAGPAAPRGGRHDKLVQQMQRATTLPVRLAEAGHAAAAGHVYYPAAELGVDRRHDAACTFTTTPTATCSSPACRPRDSAVLLLSGSDPAMVDAAIAHAGRGALRRRPVARRLLRRRRARRRWSPRGGEAGYAAQTGPAAGRALAGLSPGRGRHLRTSR